MVDFITQPFVSIKALVTLPPFFYNIYLLGQYFRVSPKKKKKMLRVRLVYMFKQ